MTSDNLLDIIQRGSVIPQRVSGLQISMGNGVVATLLRGEIKTWSVEIFYGDEPAPSPKHALRVTRT